MASQSQKSTASGPDALSILKDDHEKVEKLFKAFDKTRNKSGPEAKAAQVGTLCLQLAVHTAVEEQVFYPAVAKAIGGEDLLGEAAVEHGEAKHLIAMLEGMEPGDPLYDPTVMVLGEYVQHHVREEQDKLFPEIRKGRIDLEALGAAVLSRKEELLAEAESKGIGHLLESRRPGVRKRAN